MNSVLKVYFSAVVYPDGTVILIEAGLDERDVRDSQTAYYTQKVYKGEFVTTSIDVNREAVFDLLKASTSTGDK